MDRNQRAFSLWLIALSSASLPWLLFASPQPPRDPAVWGEDHVGKPSPQFASGDECLFCHRVHVGDGWATNRHGQAIRQADPQGPEIQALRQMPSARDVAGQIELVMGSRNRLRFFKRSEEHGRLDLLSVQWSPATSGAEGKLVAADNPHWDGKTFGDSCAGCHASGVDSTKRTFAAESLDCFVCHGDVPAQHTTRGLLAYLSPHRNDPAAVVTSVCAQCHIRTGNSKSTGLPYPNNFVAGDNLFRDFKVDLSDDAIRKLNPGDRHVQENVRDVVMLGREDVTCLSCHDIHRQSSKKHHDVADGGICLSCHDAESKKTRASYTVSSRSCEY